MLSDKITIVTSVYINIPIRFDYFKGTIDSFYECNLFPDKIKHLIWDDRSPIYTENIKEFCDDVSFLTYAGRSDSGRGSFYRVFKDLISLVDTPYVMYLEPDHHFYNKYDFITPIINGLKEIKDLTQVYLRTPLLRTRPLPQGDILKTDDLTLLSRHIIDDENTMWIGRGRNHESFSLMPSIFNTRILQEELTQVNIPVGGPYELEVQMESRWRDKQLVGYLNYQSFCYHVGKEGKTGSGGFLSVGDLEYENIWGSKIL
jgi:hypothetical protein